MDARRLTVLALLVAAPAWAAAQTVSLTTGGKHVQIMVGDTATLPVDFPADVVLPEMREMLRVQRSGTTTMVEFDTPGDPGTVARQFRDCMLANGWASAPVRTPGDGEAQAWVKDKRAVVAWLLPSAAGARLQVQVLPRH